jgi:hypothetical protein
MSRELSRTMIDPRKAKVIAGANEAWFYIDPTYIQVYITSKPGSGCTPCCRLTRQQLERALAVMDGHKKLTR